MLCKPWLQCYVSHGSNAAPPPPSTPGTAWCTSICDASIGEVFPQTVEALKHCHGPTDAHIDGSLMYSDSISNSNPNKYIEYYKSFFQLEL